MKKQELRLITWSIILATLICGLKFYTYYLSRSVVILSDALESIINVVTGLFAFYSIRLSARPSDANHPYGHGKIEFFSIAFEGTMIAFAGVGIVYSAVIHYIHPQPLNDLHAALGLVALSGAANALIGWWLVKRGKKLESLTLEGNGRHILSDSYSSVGVLIAVGIITVSGWVWVDPLASIIAGLLILVSGYRLLRKSVSGLMDENDLGVVDEVVAILSRHREPAWIDIHNMRVQRFGTHYHIDCHVTLPYYYTLETVHDLISRLAKIVNDNFTKGEVEFFIHADPCLPECCHYCTVENCPARKEPYNLHIEWSRKNVLPNRKHYLENATFGG
ncbi:cation diffusion facilitator family transporter [Dinghuibacter silviterrae]|uniref:Cation diffusion facilitator family transporter n=1 Tax=Dinghuibacter silviterrae TaxID=1539049 RepID=A0A4R8DVP1_9BACT|nr:cation diffusion facilitator family transporter [Dinghuibacter silviterrae]TDX02269.1 cation diffusion facilitator family transporter [Dinghuibacter silviterrae]